MISFPQMRSLLQLIHEGMDYLRKAEHNSAISKQDVIHDMLSKYTAEIHLLVCTPTVANYCLPIDPSPETDEFLEEIERTGGVT